jgi:hypothetical protein
VNLDALAAAMVGDLVDEDALAESASPSDAPLVFPATAPVAPATPVSATPSGSSWRSAPLPPNWKTLRATILRRDKGRCQAEGDADGIICGATATDVDHVIPASQGGTDDPSNLRALCAWHHRRKTGHEGGTAAAAARPSRLRRPERHPGLSAGDPRQAREWTSTYRKTER